MTGPSILSRYLATRFLTAFISMFVITLLLFFITELIELPRRMGPNDLTSLANLMLLALLRLPSMAEQTLTFSVLYGSMSAFVSLSRRQELIIIRAAGLSAWQILLPPLLVALLIGLVSIMVYNPLATVMTSKFERLEARIGSQSKGKRLLSITERDLWLRQTGKIGPSVIYAKYSTDHGLKLFKVIVLRYSSGSGIVRWINAEKAELLDGEWLLTNARVSGSNNEVVFWDTYTVDTNLSPAQVIDSFVTPNSVSFWALPKFIELAENAGLSATRFRLEYQVLLAKPLLMCAMVLIAAMFSMQLFRMGNILRMVVGGLTTGFLLFFTDAWARELGGLGTIPVAMAAWSPAMVAMLIGITVVLIQEEG